MWARAWWEAFGEGRRWRVMGVWAGNRLAGLAPFCLERTRSGARRLRLLGSPEADYGGILAAPDLQDQVARVMAEAVYEDPCWDVLWMPEVPHHALATRRFLEGLQRRRVRLRSSQGCTLRVPLAKSWDEYVAQLSRGRRKRFLQKARRLEELGAQVVRVDDPGDPARGIDAFIELHTRQWERRHTQPGLVLRGPAVRFHRLLSSALARRGALDLCWLEARGSAQAVVYDFRLGRSVYSYMSAMASVGTPRSSPTIVLTLWRIKAAIADGYAYYDLLRGDEPYKRTLGARPCPNSTYLVAHPRRWRAWWYLALAPLRTRLLRREAMSAGVPRGEAGSGE